MKKIISSISVLIMALPVVVSGQSEGIVPDCDGPNCTFDHLIALFANVFNFFIFFGIVVSSLAFAYAGFLYITAQGDTAKVKRATKIFTNFAVGLFLLLSSFLIINQLLSVLGVGETFTQSIIG